VIVFAENRKIDTMAVASTNTTTAVGPHGPEPPLIEAKTLTEGLVLLAEFASLDSSEYQASFAYPTATTMTTTTWPNTNNRGRLDSDDDDSSTRIPAPPDSPEQEHRRALLRLEQLQSQQNVQQTPLPDLWRAIHRLHSNLAILQENESSHAAEMKQMRDEISSVQRKNQRLTKAVQVLKKQNGSLKEKLREKRSVLKQARSFFVNSQEMQRGLEQENKAIKLQAHEQFLLASRERVGSTDSNFSDADALFFAPNVEGAGDSTLAPPTESSDTEQSDTLSLQSIQSNGSLITDDGVSTVKLNPENLVVSTPINNYNSSPMSHVSVASDLTASTSCHLPGGPLNHPASPCRPGIYKLCFPYKQPHGLTIVAIPLKDLPQPPKGKLTNEVLKEEDGSDSDEAPKTHNTFRLPNLLGGSRRQEDEIKGNAFVVAACDGDHIDPKPTVGARIVSIGRQPVDQMWKLRDFLERLNDVAGLQDTEESPIEEEQDDATAQDATTTDEDSATEEIVACIEEDDSTASPMDDDEKKTTDRTFVIYFRNDALTKKQRDMLSKKDTKTPSAKDDRVSTPEHPREHRAFGLGFLKIGSGKSEKKVDETAIAEGTDGKDKESNSVEYSEDEAVKTESSDLTTEPRPKSRNPLFFWGRDPETTQNDTEDQNGERGDGEDTKDPQSEKDGEADAVQMDAAGENGQEEVPSNAEAAVAGPEAKDENVGVSSLDKPESEDNPSEGQNSHGKGKSTLFFWGRGDKKESDKVPSEDKDVSSLSRAEASTGIEQSHAKPSTLPPKTPTNTDSEKTSQAPSSRLSSPFWRTSPRSNKPTVSIAEDNQTDAQPPEL